MNEGRILSPSLPEISLAAHSKLLSFSPEAVVRGSGEVSEIRTRIGSVRDRCIDGADFMQRERERERGSEERIWDGAIVFF
jgi:hypothetical protein